jgi:hypothetical protein
MMRAARVIRFFLLIIIFACDEELIIPVSAQPYYDPSKVCSYCALWTISNTFPSSTITPGTYTINLTTSNENSHPWDDGFLLTLWNTGSSTITVTVSGAYKGNGIYELKPNDGVTVSEVFYPGSPNEKLYPCYAAALPVMDIRLNITNSGGQGSMTVSVLGSSMSCNATLSSRQWDLTIN